MKFERYHVEVIVEFFREREEVANLRWADLSDADLSDADLRWADLRWADLRWADLRWANLRWADLRWANLRRANLSDADLSGSKGLLSPAAWLAEHFASDADGLLVYKAIGETSYNPPDHWTIAAGEFLTEVADPSRTSDCGCGVSFGTLDYCKSNYPKAVIWQCRIRWMDLAGVVVPYHTDGKARCERLELLHVVEDGAE